MSLSERRRARQLVSASAVFAIVAAAAAFAQQAYEPGDPVVSIRELMEKTITPASNTLWGAYEPPADDATWDRLEEAAVTMLAAAQITSLGGTGPMDDEWAKEPAWEAFNRIMLNASRDALVAVRARDHEALLAAGDALYPPCEGCHLQFNPGVVGAEQ